MYKLVVEENPEEVGQRLADFISKYASQVISKKGVVKLGLAGGSSPRRTYEMLREGFTLWERTLIFPTDERYVPSEDPKSNYRFLRETLGDRAKIYRVKTELPLKEACMDLDTALSKAGSMDLTLLGVGKDGHTASIFPGVPCDPCGENACTSVSPDGLERISMSLSYINLSSKVVFLVLGEEKREVLEKLLKGEDIPASRVRGEILVFTDIHSPSSSSSFSTSK